ncbi:MAG: hypothetical protein IT221_02680 [Fluviicola sp.]|nr:hypothetical protein [Fluviicola sp.]
MTIAFLDTETVCAKVKEEGGVRGSPGIVYVYKYKGKTYTGGFGGESGICLELECYLNNECLDVEVSTLFPFMSRVKVTKSKYSK